MWWLEQGAGVFEHHDQGALAWTTPNKVLLELATMRLRQFTGAVSGTPTLICAPYALHDALVTDFSPGHSVVEALQGGGIERLYVTDWRSASTEMRFLSIDNYLADLNVAIDEIGAPVHLIGLCQGGWLSLIYAIRFPQKVRRLVLVGAPVDVSVESELSRMVAATIPAAFEGLVSSEGGIARGDHMLPAWAAASDAARVLQKNIAKDEVTSNQELFDRFDHWYGETLNLPGVFYLEIVNWIFRENRLAKGAFIALGREIHLGQLETPVFLLAGSEDEVVPAEQALATASLLGTPTSLIEKMIIPSTHLGLFVGSRTLATAWPRIARWLQRQESQLYSTKTTAA
ncbi:MAG TPA: alpha/beta fold hydrolase [Bradyrhizobium sp.]|nr:alpha/beta fold hydrolase [Bradyrhizobium sp.]